MIEEHPEAVRGAVKAYIKAIDYIKKNREESIRIILKDVPYLDQEGAEGNYDMLLEPWDVVLEPRGVEHMAEVCRIAKGSTLKPGFDDLVDQRFLMELTG